MSKNRVVTMLALTQLLMGATYLVTKLALRGFPLSLGLFRFSLAGAVLALVVRNSGGERVRPADRGWFLLGALLAVPLNQGLFLVAMQYAPAAHGALLYATTPLLVLLLSVLLLGERPGLLRILGILLGFSGVAVVLTERGLALATAWLKGDLMLLGAVLIWAFYTILVKRLVGDYPASFVTALTLGLGALLFLPVGLPAAIAQNWQRVGPVEAGSLVYLALVTSVFGYLMVSWGLSRLEASRVAVLSNLQPVSAAILGWAVLGEPITARFVAGALVVVCGVFLAEFS